MRVFFDTEFIENGSTIDLISIGMVKENGYKLYLENSECDLTKANSWVRENVLPHLTGLGVPRSGIRDQVYHFLGGNSGQDLEFWAYYADYDWVVLCQLFGTMIDLPMSWPKYCNDLKQLCRMLGDPRLPANDKEHNALDDALWNQRTYEFLRSRMIRV